MRDMGHDDAANDLAMLFEADAERAEKQAAEEKRKAGLPGIKLVSDDPAQRHAEAESRAVAEALARSRVGESWGSAGSLLDDRGPNR